jgi:cytochrome b561
MIDRLIVNILEWAAGHADEGRFSPVAILFHWTMAALVVVQLGLGWWMGRLPVGGDKVGAYNLHYAIGVVMLVLILGRIGWRLLAPEPINDADKPGWESVAATITHYVFYVCLFGLPLSGWAMISATARDQELTLLGLAPWPLLPLQALSTPMLWAIEATAEWLHWGMVVALILLVPMHVIAALKRHFVNGDDVLHGMLPIVKQRSPGRSFVARRYRALEREVKRRARRLWPPSQPRSTARPRSS